LLNFSGELTHESALLKWQTATETNTSIFNIQRSIDGLRFSNAGKLNAAGNSVALLNYTFTDALAGLTPLPPALYYRIQEVDKNGIVYYSKIIRLTPGAGDAAPVVIYPNPVENALTVKLGSNTGTVSLSISGVDGKIYTAQQVNNIINGNSITINTTALAPGIYILHIQYSGKSEVYKFMKR
jgi:hypothetical protein